jgi:hypothetical protein
VVETRTGQTGEARDADDAFGVGIQASAFEVGAQDEKCAEQARRDHQAVGAERDRAEMDERIH